MASNIERLTVKDTFTNWRDKLNALIDVAVLAPMADEDGIMHIDVTHCNTREVRFGVPVVLESDVRATEVNCTGSFTSSITATTIQETVEAGLKLTGKDGYIPWVSGNTQNGVASIWTSSYDDSLHFSYVDVDGELVNTFQWNPETNTITANIQSAEIADSAHEAERLQTTNLSEDALPGSYPVLFGSVVGDSASGAWDSDFTYDPRNGILTVPKVKGDLDGNAKTATSAGKLTAPVTISLGTDASGSVPFDGSRNVTIPCNLNASGVTAGLYGPSGNVNVPRTNRRFTVPSFRVDAKGRITQAYTRTVEFPFPEVDVDTELSSSSVNPVQNRVLAAKFSEIDERIDNTSGTDVATTSTSGLMSASDKVKLNGLSQYPRISSITMQNYDAGTNEVVSINTKSVSSSKPSQLVVNAKGGITGSLNVSDTSGSSSISLDIGMQLSSIAGDGLKEVDGRLVPVTYSGPVSSTKPGTSGMVPAATKAQENLFLNGAGQWANPVGTSYNNATQSSAGLMSAADKTKLDGIRAGATEVSVARELTSGTKVATITINGTSTILYAEKNTDTTYSVMKAATSDAAGKEGLVPAPAKGAQAKYLRGDATWQSVYDATTIDTKLNSKANIASPAFTGTPTAPPASAGANTTQIATTAWVRSATGNTSLNAATASKLGTATVGGVAKPIYLNSGAPAACSSTVGSGTQPVYMNAGTIAACNGNAGGATKPVYMSNGTITACSGTVGEATKPVYMSNGTITACSTTVGGTAKPVYMNAGAISALTATVGGTAKPVYMNAGAISALTATVGGAHQLTYLSSGTITAGATIRYGTGNPSGGNDGDIYFKYTN